MIFVDSKRRHHPPRRYVDESRLVSQPRDSLLRVMFGRIDRDECFVVGLDSIIDVPEQDDTRHTRLISYLVWWPPIIGSASKPNRLPVAIRGSPKVPLREDTARTGLEIPLERECVLLA